MYAAEQILYRPMISCIARVIVLRHTGPIVSFVSESANLVRAFLEADKIAEGAEHPLPPLMSS